MPPRSLFDGSEPYESASARTRATGDSSEASSVSELVARLKSRVEPAFANVWVSGEIAEFRGIAGSGHAYFALKDAASMLRAKMWRSSIAKLKFPIENGASVLAHGSVEIYGPRGELSLTIDRIVPKGIGEAAAAFEALQKKLRAEGLFSDERKRPLPFLPRAIGLVTSREGAAIRDFLRHLEERFPVRVVLAATAVQGEAAPPSIASAIELLSEEARDLGIEALAVVRGGGGMEDLASFNTEIVARAIVNCSIPVVTGVGHEIDTTIADLVADRRAKTPTDAANVIVPDRDAMLGDLQHLWQRMSEATDRSLEDAAADLIQLHTVAMRTGPVGRIESLFLELESLGESAAGSMNGHLHTLQARHERLRGALASHAPRVMVENQTRALETAGRALVAIGARRLQTAEGAISVAAARLEGRSPVAILGRGYSLTRRAESTALTKDASELAPGDLVETRLSRGSFTSKVVEIRPGAATP